MFKKLFKFGKKNEEENIVEEDSQIEEINEEATANEEVEDNEEIVEPREENVVEAVEFKLEEKSSRRI